MSEATEPKAGDTPPQPTPEPPKKRARKTPAPTAPDPGVDKPGLNLVPTLDGAQLARVEALRIARELIVQRSVGITASSQVDVMDMINVATFILTGEDPWGDLPLVPVVAGVVRRGDDDDSPGLTFAGAPAAPQSSSSTDQTGADA